MIRDIYVIGDPDGKIRLCIDQGEDPPPFMQGAAKAHAIGGLVFEAAAAAICATMPNADECGLWWASAEEAKKARLAALSALPRGS